MITYKWIWNADDDFSMQYSIPAGESIPEHKHGPELLHDVTVVSGRVEVRTEGGAIAGERGQTLTFDSAKPHQVAAVTDSVTVHKFLNGIPADYKTLPLSEHSGQF